MYSMVCIGVRVCVCTSVMFTHTQSELNTRRIQHAENHKARSNCKLEIRRRRRWRRNADADCDCDGELEATDTCSLRTCLGEAQSQRQLASEWTVLASLVAAVQPQQQQQQQYSSVSR